MKKNHLDKVRKIVQTYVPNNFFFQKIVAYARLYDLKKNDYGEIEKKLLTAKKADPAFRSEIVKECFEKWPEIAAQIRKEAQEKLPLSADYKDRELDSRVLDDVVFSYFALGFSPDEYIYFRLEKRTIDERQEYFSNKMRKKYHTCIDNLIDSSTFSKYNTYLKFQEYFKRDVLKIENDSQFPVFEAFVKSHSKYVKKDVDGMSGREVELVDSANCGKTVRQQFDEMVAEQKYIIEELIIQSEDMARFNSSSVNTVRCITMNTKDGVKVAYGYFRTGSSGSFVDNCGIRCGVDMETGQAVTDGFDERAYQYRIHPDTGTVYKGFQFPEWNQLLSIAKNAASKLPGIKIIGWDFAHTDKGWVIVEGNAMSSIELIQIPFERGMRKELEQYFREMEPIIECNFE